MKNDDNALLLEEQLQNMVHSRSWKQKKRAKPLKPLSNLLQVILLITPQGVIADQATMLVAVSTLQPSHDGMIVV